MKESSQASAQPTQVGHSGVASIASNEQKLCFLQKLLQCMDLSDLSENDQRQLQHRMALFSTPSTVTRTEQVV